MHDAEHTAVFETWIDAHAAILFKVARAYGATRSDRDDLFQEIAVQLWRSVPSFRGDAAVGTWIYRVALNTALAWKRREHRHAHGKEPLTAGVLVALPSSDPNLDWLYDRITALDDVNRSVALLWLDGLTYREIGEITGLTEGAVGVRIHRIKAALVARRHQEDDVGPR